MLSIIMLTASCKKLRKEGSEAYLGGRVVLVNSNTPVPNVRVDFLRYTSGSWLGPNSYEYVSSSISDENGHFDIPKDMDADVCRAYGPTELFELPSYDVGVSGYLANGGIVVVGLVPPAWIRLSTADIEPIDLDILHVLADSTISEGGTFVIANGITIKCEGNTPYQLNYVFIYDDWSQSSWRYSYIQSPIPFDTTDFILEY